MSARTRDILSLIAFLLVCQAAGGIGGLFTASSLGTWYAELRKPPYNPPNWVFGPVWTTLYVLMGIAAWLVWRRRGEGVDVRPGLVLFAVQIVLNALWSIIFFGLKSPGPAFAELVVLWGAIFATMLLFLRTSIAAGILLVPYLVWVSFAGVLNYAIWALNRY